MPTAVYEVGFTGWSVGLLLVAALYLAHAFRARPAGLPVAVLRRAWYSLWASCALVVLMVLFALSAEGWLAEPLLDVALALYVVCFVVMLVDASAMTKHRRVKSSLARRVGGASGAVGFGFGVALITGPALHVFRAGLLAGAISGATPLVPAAMRALFGIERLPVTQPAEDEVNPQLSPLPVDLEERAALHALLAGRLGLVAGTAVTRQAIAHWHRCLGQLQQVPLPDWPTFCSNVLVFLLWTCDDGLERTKKFDHRMPEEMIALLELLFPGNLDEQKSGLLELMRATAVSLTTTNFDRIYKEPPGAMEMLEAECIARVGVSRRSRSAGAVGAASGHATGMAVRRRQVMDGVQVNRSSTRRPRGSTSRITVRVGQVGLRRRLEWSWRNCISP